MKELKPVYRGDDFALEIHIRNQSTQQPMDITDWRFDSTMKLSPEQPDEPILNSQGQRIVLSVTSIAAGDEAEQGIVLLKFESQDTVKLIATTYQIDVQAVVSDAVQTVFAGSIKILADVTHKGA